MATSLKFVGETEVRQFILYLQSRKGLKADVSAHTLNNRVRALRAFFAWLDRKGYTRDHLIQDL